MNQETDSGRELLRHTLATLAYRGGKAVRNAPESFADYRGGESSRTPGQILAHIGDLLDWGLSIAEGQTRFFKSLEALDQFLSEAETLTVTPQALFQGPVADAFTHVGQIAMLRRLAGEPMRGENYFKADIVVGRVGSEQSSPRSGIKLPAS